MSERADPRGRKRKYPIHVLDVGESLLLPWLEDALGERLDQRTMLAAIAQEERRFNKLFRSEATLAGLKVTRIG